ncbi:MAG: nucleotidyltransferase family protein [Prevotella sp.]
MEQDLFFRFVRFCLGDPSLRAEDFRDMDWEGLWKMANEQSLVGFFFGGMKRLPREMMPESDLLLEWIGQSGRMENRNRAVCEAIGKLNRRLHKDGIKTCLLKGESNALRYPYPLQRKPGDIDLWVLPADGKHLSLRQWRQYIMDYVNGLGLSYDLAPHHVGFKMGDIEVELHVTASTLHSSWHNRRLQQWYRKVADEQFAHQVTLPNGSVECAVPYANFDAVFQLSHIFHHLFEGGVSLRIVLDYYYVVMSPEFNVNPEEFAKLLRHLGLYRVAQGMSYVMQTVLHLSADRYPVPADEKAGRKILDWMFEGGEFGFYGKNAKLNASRGTIGKYINDTRRALSLLPVFPTEAFFEPFTHIHRYVWGVMHKSK